MWVSTGRLKQSIKLHGLHWQSADSQSAIRVPRLKFLFLLGFPCQDCCDCRWASCRPRSCCQGHLCRALFASSWRWFMLPDGKGQSTIAQHNMWPTYTPTICCLIPGKCTETLIKILILFHSWPTCGMYILHPRYICSSRAVAWYLWLPSETGPVICKCHFLIS